MTTTPDEQLTTQAERVFCRLADGRFMVAAFVVVEVDELERAHESPAVTVRPPGFMDTVNACELIGQGSCRPFAAVRQLH